MRILAFIKERLSGLLHEEDAQGGFEYMLIVGGVSVAVIVAIAAIGPGALATAVCSAIATIPEFSTFSC